MEHMNNTEESFLGRVMSGGLWLSASALAGRFMGLFTTILILRTLSVRDYGTYNLLLAAFGLLASFFISGFDSLVINDLARERGEGRHDRIKRLFLEYGLLKALIGVGLFFISFFGSWFLARWYDAGVVRLLHTISYLFLFVAVERMMNLLFEVYLKFRAIALFDIVEEAAKLFFFFVFVRYLGEGVGGLVRAYMFSTALGLVLFAPYGLTLLRRLLGYRAVRERMLWGLARNHGKWGIASQYLTEAQRSVMPWLVKIFAGTEAVGLYSLAEGIYAQIVSLFPLANLLSPLIPGEIRNKDRMRSIIVYGIKYGTALFALIGVVAFFGIPFLLTWFFPRYLPAVLLFRIMLLALLTTAGANIVNTILYSFREQRILFFLMTVRLAFLVAATSTFMAAFGLAGAAMGFVASAVFFVLIRYWSLRRVAPDIHIPAADFFSWGAEDRRFLARVGSETLRYSSALLGLVRAFLRVLYRALLRQWAVFLIIAVVLASCAPILFLGRIYFDEEQLGFYYPQSFFLGQSLRAGTSLFWNNAYYGGVSVSL
ncbi:MAG: oligosaccharide flippase family protein, partial [Candidatus Sungbacteria bacterium]|nr:oligosaccharide flippase family protein [Candidatus Sungbacteria bacterium]